MTEQHRHILTPREVLGLKDEISTRFEQLPPEHQASMTLVLAGRVMKGEWRQWLHEAIALYAIRHNLAEQWRNVSPETQEEVREGLREEIPETEHEASVQEVEKSRSLPSEANPIRKPEFIFISITIGNEDLVRVGLTEVEIAALDEDNIEYIAQAMIDHFQFDAFWDELEHAAYKVLYGNT